MAIPGLISSAPLNFLQLPPAPSENPQSRQRHDGFCDHDGDKNPGFVKSGVKGKKQGQWDLKEPVTKDIDDRRRESVSGPVQGIDKHHPEAVGDKADRDDSQAI